MDELMALDKDPYYYVLNPYITIEDFCHAKDVYLNNQEYFLKHGKIEELKGLEHWFIHVIEPIPKRNNDPSKDKKVPKSKLSTDLRKKQDVEYELACNKWLSREMMKSRGYTFYCNKAVRNKVYISASERKAVTEKLDFLKFIMEL